MQPQQASGSTIQTAMMIWIAILFSVGVFWFLVTQAPPPAQSSSNDTMVPLFAGVAFLATLGSFVIPSYLIRAQIRSGTGGKDASLVARQVYMTAFMIRISLRDMIAVLGFLAASQGAGELIFLYFGSAAAILLLLAKPSEEHLKEIEQKLRMPNSTPG